MEQEQEDQEDKPKLNQPQQQRHDLHKQQPQHKEVQRPAAPAAVAAASAPKFDPQDSKSLVLQMMQVTTLEHLCCSRHGKSPRGNRQQLLACVKRCYAISLNIQVQHML